MKYQWFSSKDWDTARVIGTFMNLKSGFFQSHNFLVTPYSHPRSVFVPDLNYASVVNLPIKQKYLQQTGNQAYKKSFINLKIQLEKYTYPKFVDLSEIKNKFEQIQKKLEENLRYIFPKVYSETLEIRIIYTPFGTTSSFDYKKENKKIIVWIWLRSSDNSPDRIVTNLIHAIISIFVLIVDKTPNVNTYHWKVREGIIDFLLNNTILKKYSTTSNKTLQSLKQQDISMNLLKDSQTYLQKLKMSIHAPVIEKRGTIFCINDQHIENLTAKENIFLQTLYDDCNSYVTKDTICEKVYADPDDCSDWAITKLVQRVRSKITRSGIIYSVIQTSRKMGYKLVCKV